MIYLAIAAIIAAATIVETKFLLAYLKDRGEKERAPVSGGTIRLGLHQIVEARGQLDELSASLKPVGK